MGLNVVREICMRIPLVSLFSDAPVLPTCILSLTVCFFYYCDLSIGPFLNFSIPFFFLIIVTYVLALFEGFSVQLSVLLTARRDCYSEGVHRHIVTFLRSDYWMVTFLTCV